MKRHILLLLALCLLSLSGLCGELYDKLIAIEGVASVEELPAGLFAERYVVTFEQPLDHRNPARGRFEQRVIIGHVGADRPVVFVTEGYGAARATGVRYREELSSRLGANQIFVEHRYFGESIPSSEAAGWDHLTAENAATDLHRLRTAIGALYPEKWIATGVSKGGENALLYRMFYPMDVDVTVAYVAPVCLGLEDGRFTPFLESVGTESERTTILEFQREVLRRREHLVPMLEEFAAAKGMKFNLPIDEIFDYCVLEYGFSIWQNGTAVSFVPSSDSPHEEMFEHLTSVSPPHYLTPKSEPAFFAQATRELGYYGYNTAPFEGLLRISTARGYMSRLMLPATAQKIKFNDALSRKTIAFYKSSDPRLICIYGENDPWRAAALDSTLFEGKQNMKLIIEPKGSHRARIKTLPESVQNSVWKTIEGWVFGI